MMSIRFWLVEVSAISVGITQRVDTTRPLIERVERLGGYLDMPAYSCRTHRGEVSPLDISDHDCC